MNLCIRVNSQSNSLLLVLDIHYHSLLSDKKLHLQECVIPFLMKDESWNKRQHEFVEFPALEEL